MIDEQAANQAAHDGTVKAGPVSRLILVVASLLPVSAAWAETDGAFAASLARLEAVRAGVAVLQAKPRELHPPQAPRASEAVWDKVLLAVRVHGEYKPGEFDIQDSFMLEDTAGDKTGDHVVNRIVVVGQRNEDGRFEAEAVRLGFEDYRLDAKDGNWRLEHFLALVSVHGQIQNVSYGFAVLNPAGDPISVTPADRDPADQKVKARFEALLGHWAGWTPGGARP